MMAGSWYPQLPSSGGLWQESRLLFSRKEGEGPRLWFPPGPSGGASLLRGALGSSSSLRFPTISTVFTVQVQRAMWASQD